MNPVVHVVDDDESFLRSVSRLLRASGFEVAAFSSVQDFLRRANPDVPGCVVTDLQMPRQSGLDLQEALARSRHPLPVVFLTSKGDIPTSVRAMRGGAEDFLTKRAPKARLIEAINRALVRGAIEDRDRARNESLHARAAALTPRERQVLGAVARGLLNKEIAAELGVAERTVKLHRSNLVAKLGLRSPAELGVFAREAGVIAA